MRVALKQPGWREVVGVLALGVYIPSLALTSPLGVTIACALLAGAALGVRRRAPENWVRKTAIPTAVLGGGLWMVLYRVKTPEPPLEAEGELSGFQQGLEATQSALPPVLYIAMAIVVGIWMLVLVAKSFRAPIKPGEHGNDPD
ncbi:hypothetical protein [Thioalkalivibrio sp. ALE16]|uniref:hypothetical protein n=1 Tax=Thioalkalivibrio sp. ALE16 TaxID=1158172 RepID=UPI000362822E|nr:hypothetical protein [Thioalkalivibrio sp. ALE16]